MRFQQFGAIGLLCTALVTSNGCLSNLRCPDATPQVARYGIDYDQTVRESYKMDSALRRLFLLSYTVDASGSDEYATDLRQVLDAIGEDRFIRGLQSVGWSIQQQIISKIQHHEGIDQEGDSWSQFITAYPRLGKLASRPVENP
jgi:hypothetical protein